jgi:hypothetical protein
VQSGIYRSNASLWLGNFNSLIFDYVTRQEVQGQHLNWYIVEQCPSYPLMPMHAASGRGPPRRSSGKRFPMKFLIVAGGSQRRLTAMHYDDDFGLWKTGARGGNRLKTHPCRSAQFMARRGSGCVHSEPVHQGGEVQ